MQSRPTVVVLAAGKGSRFKGPAHKLEQSLGDLSVLGSTLRNAIESHLPVVVVTTQALAGGASPNSWPCAMWSSCRRRWPRSASATP